MRLKEFEIVAIKDAVCSLDKEANVYLFGSRTDDMKKGGDIDLLIISDKLEFGDKYKIYSSYINDVNEAGIIKKTFSVYELNLSQRVALVFGNEHTGVSDEVKNLSDKNFMIPMYGMVQSLNVSVAVAVCLYEALRQRELKGKYLKSGYSKTELQEKLKHYSDK